MCYRNKFRRSRSNRLDVCTGFPKIWGTGPAPWDGGVTDHAPTQRVSNLVAAGRLGVGRVHKNWAAGASPFGVGRDGYPLWKHVSLSPVLSCQFRSL